MNSLSGSDEEERISFSPPFLLRITVNCLAAGGIGRTSGVHGRREGAGTEEECKRWLERPPLDDLESMWEDMTELLFQLQEKRSRVTGLDLVVADLELDRASFTSDDAIAIFSCGHGMPRRLLLEEELPRLRDHFLAAPVTDEKVQWEVDRLTAEYHSSPVIRAACPSCITSKCTRGGLR